jgi:hypothetical protein
VGRRLRVERLSSGLQLIDDCYNANPLSMGAALQTLRDLVDDDEGTRPVAVLGDMLELGEFEAEAHRGVGEAAARAGVALLAAFGPRARALADAAATILAGACQVDAPGVTRVPATQLDPQTDVPELMVTTQVRDLSEAQARQALAGGEAMARRLLLALPLKGAHFSVAGRKLLIARAPGGGLLARRSGQAT